MTQQVFTYDTRADAIADTIPVSVKNLLVKRYATGHILSNIPYIPGTSTGPDAFQEAGGHWWELDLSGDAVRTAWFGVRGNGTDETVGAQKALTAAAGKTLRVNGIINVSASLLVPANTRITSNNRYVNGFAILPQVSLSNGILQIFNTAGGNVIDQLIFLGNTVAMAATSTGAIMINIDAASGGDINNVTVRDCIFYVFNHTFWIWVVHSAQNANVNKINNLDFINLEFDSSSGNAPAAYGNSFIGLTANSFSPLGSETGSINFVKFQGLRAKGYGVAGLINAFGAVNDVSADNLQAFAMGNYVDPTLRFYTVMLYQSDPTRARPKRSSFTNLDFNINHSIALYFAGCEDVSVAGVTIRATATSSVAPTLSHGAAINFNGCFNFSVTAYTLIENYGGIAVSMPNVASVGSIGAGSIISSANQSSATTQPPYGILLTGDPTVPDSILTSITGAVIELTGDVPIAIDYNGGYIGRLEISACHISSSYGGYVENSAFQGASRKFTGNFYCGALRNYPVSLSASAVPVTIACDEVDFVDQLSGSGGGYRTDGSTSCVIDGITLRNKAYGLAAYSANGSQGNLQKGVVFANVAATQAVAGSLGLGLPGFSADVGAFIEALPAAAGPTGTTPNAYWTLGWKNAAAGNHWTPVRSGMF